MVISGYLEDKLNEKRKRDAARRKAEEDERIAEAVAQAVAEAVAQAHQEWADWNRQRLQAEEEGKPFNEPPPEFPQNIGEPR